MRQMIPLEEARQIMLDAVRPLETIKVDLPDAFGMALAEDVTAPHPLPPFDRSPLDGYALRAADTVAAGREHPAALTVTETIYAGHTAKGTVEPGTAMGIMTGAPLPPGADCVIRFEDTRREGNQVYIFSPLQPEQGVIHAGEDVAAGETVLTAGVTVDAGVTGLLAALGQTRAAVRRQPRVALFSTGDELLEPYSPLVPGRIYNSNLPALAAQVREAGGIPLPGGNRPDQTALITATIEQALKVSDLIVSTGGVSVGERDVVKEAMEAAGVEPLFWRAGFKPGTPVVCGRKDGRLVVGLSGNPAAAMITFILLVRPVLRRLGGHREIDLPRVQARMAVGFPKGGRQRRFVRAVVRWRDGGYLARPAGLQSPGAMRSLVEGNALLDVPAGHGPLKEGEMVEAILIK
ncbi:molybdopterin molybdotransferase MoeA [Desulfotomaculum copahuensis]|uniref:Molybdopterin molybdenumtransferase n=1 Tax=Desulfotomaculum copahuensis TaxID=1838280 RepID=A0A1B7LG85_9FIRM|nr:gephyrin-like molybdotransferase Glp [Desulfotomaculum copahuensis]OAT84837.1 molybdopterin molybdenumtransferase MoeA [Desulfotomaculum copahuensis]